MLNSIRKKENIMTKKYSKSFLITLCALFAMLLLTFSGTTIVSMTHAAESIALSNSTLTYVAYRRSSPNSQYNSTNKGNYSGSTYTEFEWKDMTKLKFNFDAGSQIPTGENINYTYSIELQYEQRYISDTNTSFDEYDGKITIDNVFTSSSPLNTLEEVTAAIASHEFYIDAYSKEEDVKFGERQHKNYGNGWGIYKFIVHIGLGNQSGSAPQYYDAASEFIFVAPSAITANPIIERTDASGITSIGDAHMFNIINDERDGFKYCNQNLITWYVKGESADGKKYVLSEKDKFREEFSDYQNAIFTGDPERNGNSFLFDSNRVAGTWQVYCVVYNTDGSPTQFKSEELQVSTGSPMQTSVIIWIIVACAVALLGVVILIIVFTKKKEKVW